MVAPEGKVLIRVRWDGVRIVGCEVESRRPVDACRAFVGRRAGDALALVPRVYSVCGQAQLAAARNALDAAEGRPPEPDALLRRRLGVLGETAAEYLWRFLIDLPQALGEPPVPAPVANVRSYLAAAGATPDEAGGVNLEGWRAFAQVLRRALDESLFGGEAARVTGDAGHFRDWHRAGMSGPARWLDRLIAEGYGPWCGAPAPLMPPRVDGDQVAALVRNTEGEFARHPLWQGSPRETGALARCREAQLVSQLWEGEGPGVLLRLAARLVEMVALREELESLLDGTAGPAGLGAVALAERVGAGWAETARGLLVHRVEVDGGRVESWQIVAPTEWNFHPQGPLAVGLVGQSAANRERLARGVRLCVLALDPCVAYDLEVSGA